MDRKAGCTARLGQSVTETAVVVAVAALYTAPAVMLSCFISDSEVKPVPDHGSCTKVGIIGLQCVSHFSANVHFLIHE